MVGNWVSEVGEGWSLAIVCSSTVQWGRYGTGREVPVRKIYYLGFFKDMYLKIPRPL